MSAIRTLQATAAAFGLISLAHTTKSQVFMNHPEFKRLPRFIRMYARAGWFQGSVFFLIAAIMNYRWSKSPALLLDPLDKAMAALTTAICVGSALWYGTEGDTATGGILAGLGGLQTYAAFFAQK